MTKKTKTVSDEEIKQLLEGKEKVQKSRAKHVNKNRLTPRLRKDNISVRPVWKKTAELLHVARRMYALPVQVQNSTWCPLGYDRLIELDGDTYAFPNDEAFKGLVRAKHYLPDSSYRKIADWLTWYLNDIEYNFEYTHRYNPAKGVSAQTLMRTMKYHRPLDECLLPIDERNRLFRIEVESSEVDLDAIRRGHTKEPTF